MQNVKQNLLPLITWASFVALAFSTMTEVRSFNRNEPSVFSSGKATLEKPLHASQFSRRG
jgi:hypothetical protein